jgi:hypothetical protein
MVRNAFWKLFTNNNVAAISKYPWDSQFNLHVDEWQNGWYTRDRENYKIFSCAIPVKYLGKFPDKLQLLNSLQYTLISCTLNIYAVL